MNFNRWFKAQAADVLDPKLRKLPAGLFKFLYFLRCMVAGNSGALPPADRVAFLLGSSEPVIARRLAALLAAGLLVEAGGELRLVESDDGGGERDGAEATASGADRTRRWRERRAERSYGRDAAVTRCDAAVTCDAIEKDIDQDTDTDTETARVTRGDYDEAFENFWRAFPRRDGDNPQKPAREAFHQAVASGADPQALIAAASAYGAAVASREKRFIASATRWLAEGRYRDHGPPPKPNAAAAAPGVWLAAGSPDWLPWAAWWRAMKGKSPPLDGRGGWRFPSLLPPEAERLAA